MPSAQRRAVARSTRLGLWLLPFQDLAPQCESQEDIQLRDESCRQSRLGSECSRHMPGKLGRLAVGPGYTGAASPM